MPFPFIFSLFYWPLSVFMLVRNNSRYLWVMIMSKLPGWMSRDWVRERSGNKLVIGNFTTLREKKLFCLCVPPFFFWLNCTLNYYSWKKRRLFKVHRLLIKESSLVWFMSVANEDGIEKWVLARREDK